MALPMFARGGNRVLDTTTREAEWMELHAQLAEAHAAVSVADEVLGREAERAHAAEQQLADARAHYLTGLADAAAQLWPEVGDRFGHDPMPAPGEPWADVPGDTADLPPLIAIGATELAEVA